MVLELLSHVKGAIGERVSYPVISDGISLPIENAFILSSMCKEANVLVSNNLMTNNKHFISEKTKETN